MYEYFFSFLLYIVANYIVFPKKGNIISDIRRVCAVARLSEHSVKRNLKELADVFLNAVTAKNLIVAWDCI
jgi:hypothetical protein